MDPQILRAILASQFEDIHRSHGAYTQGLDAMFEIIERARRRREVEHIVKRSRIERNTNVMF
jgi:hypothetical protein